MKKDARYDRDFLAIAKAEAVEAYVLKAIGLVESNLSPTFSRFGALEQGRYRKEIKGEDEFAGNPNVASPQIIAGTFGLLGVPYISALREGYSFEWFLLFDPVTNIRFGARVLRSLLGKYGNLSQALAAYQTGSGYWVKGRGDHAGHFRNQWYVDRVHRAIESVSEDWRDSGLTLSRGSVRIPSSLSS